MPATNNSTTNWGSDLMCTLGVGAALGVALGVLMAALEGGLSPNADVARSAVLSMYGVTGGLVGLCGGVLAWLISRSGIVAAPTAALPVGLSILGAVLTALFMLRDYTPNGLTDVPGSVSANAMVSVALWVGIGATGTRIARRREFRVSARGSRVALGLSVAVMLILAAAGTRARNSVPPGDRDLDTPNIVLIVVDALRPDHLGAHRYFRRTSPAIDEMAAQGIVFDNAYANAATVPASLGSILTGTYPCVHGAGHTSALHPSLATAPALLREAGYATIALGTRSLDARRGTGRGFHRVVTFDASRFRLSLFAAAAGLGWDRPAAYLATGHATGEEVTLEARRWVDRFDDRPYFMTVHYGDLTAPHLPPPEVFAEYDRNTSRFDPNTLYLMTSSLSDQPAPLPIKPGEVDRLIDLYDASILHLDRLIAQLVSRISEKSITRETIVVITGGRGEEFMEHGRLYQMNGVVEPVIRTPLVLWSTAGLDPSRVDALVRHVDITPSLCELAGVTPPSGIPGTSFAAVMSGGDPPRIGESVAVARGRTAINTPDWKIVRTDDNDGFALYDLGSDPWAREDVSHLHRDVLDELKRRVQSHDAECSAAVRMAGQQRH